MKIDIQYSDYRRNLILVRGISGSGKSTFAELMASKPYECFLLEEGDDDYPVYSADNYFIDKDGNYNWVGEELTAAHAWCLNETALSMEEGEEKIFVANTFTSERELVPYYDLAKRWGYRVFSVIVENRHDGLSIHDVPESSIEKQRNRFSIKL